MGGAVVAWGIPGKRGGFNPLGAVHGGRERVARVKSGVEPLVVFPLLFELLLQCLRGCGLSHMTMSYRRHITINSAYLVNIT